MSDAEATKLKCYTMRRVRPKSLLLPTVPKFSQLAMKLFHHIAIEHAWPKRDPPLVGKMWGQAIPFVAQLVVSKYDTDVGTLKPGRSEPRIYLL